MKIGRTWRRLDSDPFTTLREYNFYHRFAQTWFRKRRNRQHFSQFMEPWYTSGRCIFHKCSWYTKWTLQCKLFYILWTIYVLQSYSKRWKHVYISKGRL